MSMESPRPKGSDESSDKKKEDIRVTNTVSGDSTVRQFDSIEGDVYFSSPAKEKKKVVRANTSKPTGSGFNVHIGNSDSNVHIGNSNITGEGRVDVQIGRVGGKSFTDRPIDKTNIPEKPRTFLIGKDGTIDESSSTSTDTGNSEVYRKTYPRKD